MKLEGAVMMEVSLCLRLDLRAHMPLPSSLLAAIDTIKVFGRDAAGASSVESNLLAFMDLGRPVLSEDNILAGTLNRDGTSGGNLAPSIVDFAGEDTGLSLVETGSDVEALMAPVVRAGEPREMDLARAHVTVDTVEETLIPTRAVDVQFVGESIELVGTYADDTPDADGNLSG